MTRTQSPNHLAFIDLEMTGLDAQSDVILQAALIVTDPELRTLEEFCVDIWQPPAALERMSPFVRSMHERTGLLARIALSQVDLGSAEKQLLERVAGWCTYPAVLCGNTIGHDKRFIDRYMPGLAGYLSYRSVDVSSIKVLNRLWYGDSRPYVKPADREHDALFDIRQSVAELAFYKANLFQAP